MSSVYLAEEFEEKGCRYRNCMHVASNELARDLHEAKNHSSEEIRDGKNWIRRNRR